jgi:hypothetical protein
MGPYRIEWDTLKQSTFLYNSITKERKELPVRYPRYAGRFFAEKFVLVASSDMQCLFDLNGNRVLNESHYIKYLPQKNIIQAWVCTHGIWIFLDQDGDTLSYGRSGHHYKPKLDRQINFVQVGIDSKNLKWGALAPDANWIFSPILHDTLTFTNGQAIAEINGYSLTFFERFFKRGYYVDLDTRAHNLEGLSPEFLLAAKLKKEAPLIPSKPSTLKPKQDSALWGKARPPRFPGGESALIDFLTENYNYALLDSTGIKNGSIYLRFTVKANGKLTDFKILRGVHPILDAELTRVMKNSPQWLPAICYDIDPGQDTPPNQYCSAPFTIPFRLNSKPK